MGAFACERLKLIRLRERIGARTSFGQSVCRLDCGSIPTCVVRRVPEGVNEFIGLGYSIVTPLMIRTMDTICRFLNLDFPTQDGGSHTAFRNVAMPLRKLIMLAVIGLMWAIAIGAIGYLAVMYFQ